MLYFSYASSIAPIALGFGSYPQLDGTSYSTTRTLSFITKRSSKLLRKSTIIENFSEKHLTNDA